MIIKSYEIPTLAKGEFTLELPEGAKFIRIKYMKPLDATSVDKIISFTDVDAVPTALFVVDTEARPITRTFKLVKYGEEITGTYITVTRTADTYLYLFEI